MKKLSLLLLALIGAPVITLGVLILSFDANRYKPELIELGRSLSGRAFDIRGDISLKPALIPTITVEGVSLANAPWASHERMVDIQRLEGKIRLLPLLTGRLSIRHLIVIGANVALERNADGIGNWAFEAEPEHGAAGGGLALFDLEQVTVKESRLEYRRGSQSVQTLKVTSMSLLPDGVGQPLRLRATLLHNGRSMDVGAKLAPLARLFKNEAYELEVRLNADDVRFEMQGSIGRPLAGDEVDLAFELSAPLAALLPADLADALSDGTPLRSSGRFREDQGDCRIEEFKLKLAQSELEGAIEIDLNGERPRFSADINANYIDLSGLFNREQDEDSARLFSTEPVSMDWLGAADVQLAAAVGKIKLGKTQLQTVRVNASIDNRQLEVDKFTALVDQGTLVGTLSLNVRRDIPRISHTLSLENVSMSPLVSAAAANNFRGGHVAVQLSLTAQGISPAEWAASADGAFQLSVAEVDVLHRASNALAGDLMMNAFALLNPLTREDDHEVVECAVFKFPISNGLASASTGIGMRTERLNILGGGSIDLRTEVIDIGVNPKPREGIGLNLASFADFIRIGGTLSAPAPTTNARGAATAGLKVGAALATGGLSLLAEGLLDRASSDVDVCAVAAGSASLPGATGGESSALERAANATGNALQQAGQAVGRGFKRLIGD